MLLAIDFPPFEFIVIAVAVLIGLIGRIIEFGKQVRRKSIEAEQRAETQFGAELEEATEPKQVEPLPRLELARRPPRPRREEPVAVMPPPPPPPRARPLAPRPAQERRILRLLRTPQGVRDAVLLAEILGRPKALRRNR
jgi:hypothetical protein